MFTVYPARFNRFYSEGMNKSSTGRPTSTMADIDVHHPERLHEERWMVSISNLIPMFTSLQSVLTGTDRQFG